MYDVIAIRLSKIIIITIVSFGFLLLLPSLVTAQLCGDIDGNGVVQHDDVFYQIAIVYGGDAPICQADVDGNDGLSLRDVVFLYESVFNPPGWPLTCCPAPGEAIVPSADTGTYLFPSTDIIPADSSGAWVSIGLNSSYESRALFARLRLHVGDDAVQISNIQYNQPNFVVNYANGDPLNDADTLTLPMGVFYGTSALPAGSYKLVTFYLSVPSADTARTITYEMTTNIRPAELVVAGEDNLPIIEPTIRFPDIDNDHWADFFDNCPYTSNPDQLDSDDDGIGDACADSCALQEIGNVRSLPDWEYSIADLVYMSNWFGGDPQGPAPIYLSNGDVDGDCDIDEHDLRVMVENLGVHPPAFVECTCRPENIKTFCCRGNTGNVNGDPDDATNIADLTYLTKFLFGIPPGPMPPCWDEADVNRDGEYDVNISDVTYLVAYLFGDPQGPAPKPCPY